MAKYSHEIPSHKRKKNSSKCFVFILAFLVILSIALLGFSLIVLRINSPLVKLETVEIKNLTTGTRRNNNNNYTNMTMVTGITIKNANYGRFRFQDSRISTVFENATIGSRKIGSGFVNGREKRGINVTVQVSLMDGMIGSDGILKVRSLARLRGEILVLKKITRYRTAVMNCTMNLNLSKQEVEDLQCM